MSDRIVQLKRYKRGAYHDDGSTMTCITCRIEKKLSDRGRANQAVVTMIKISPSGSRLFVGYCEEHTPEEIEKEV